MTSLRERFVPAMQAIQEGAQAGEITAGWIDAEASDFVRFNHGRVRQAGTVHRATIELRLVFRGRQASLHQTLSGDARHDRAAIAEGLARLRDGIGESEPDPHLSLSDSPAIESTVLAPPMPDPQEVCDAVCSAAAGADLVGFYSAGPLACGFASSLGHSLWHEARPWFFDYSIYAAGDKAVKVTLAHDRWEAAKVAASIAQARREAAILHRPVKQLSPGEYRASLSPAAMAEIVGMMNWGGFSASAQKSGQSPLGRLTSGADRFHASVHLRDDLASLGAPRFQADGFQRPASLALVQAGCHGASLVSPRSAREFALEGNGATSAESAQALAMEAGDLDETQRLERLGRGVAVSNFWYLNWSDRDAARLTGMTRFATLWVEGGEAVAPLSVMRFDDSLYRMLGSRLEALGSELHRLPDTQTYENRSFGAMLMPGALLSGLHFSL